MREGALTGRAVRLAALAAALLLTACSAGDDSAADIARSPEGAPSAAAAPPATAGASPAAAKPPVDCGDAKSGGYDGAKECDYAICKQGDAEVCRMAESFNGNLFPAGDPKKVRLEGMDYLEARKVILALGWQPLGGPCEGVSQAICTDFPEIGNCSGTGVGYCDMTFRRADRCLTVVTTGGAPHRAEPEGVAVDWVRFSKAPCKKDPNAG